MSSHRTESIKVAERVYLHRVGQVGVRVLTGPLKQILTQLEETQALRLHPDSTQDPIRCSLRAYLRDDAFLSRLLFAHHGVALPRARLAIRKNTHVVSWDRRHSG